MGLRLGCEHWRFGRTSGAVWGESISSFRRTWWWSFLTFGELPGTSRVTVFLVLGCEALVWLVIDGKLPRQVPQRTRFGDLRIPDVPVEVALEWVRLNPGVIATDEPAPRPHSWPFYVAWSLSLLSSAIGLTAVLMNDGRDDDVLLWLLIPVLFIVASTWLRGLSRRPSPARACPGRAEPR
jgi:hypothetical protein